MKSTDPRRIETASLSDVGRRRASNQDACGGLVTSRGARLLVVADGMGGHAGGETASRVAVETVEEFVGCSAGDPAWLLRAALEAANRRIYEEARSDPSLSGMGTTGVALLFPSSGSAWVAHVGDSRAYRLRGGRLEQLTPDHSLVAELERRGMITAAEARVHPRRNEVLRCIGVDPDVDVDVAPVDVQPGDQYLLCSDGLCGVLTDEEMAAELLCASPELAAGRLVDAANERGGPDNITVQIARIPAAAGRARRALDALRSRPPGRPRVVIGVSAALIALALLWALLQR